MLENVPGSIWYFPIDQPKIRETAAVHEMKEMMTTTAEQPEPRPNEN